MVDDRDLKILAELQKNAGDPQKVMAARLGLTEPTLSKKIRKLMEDKVITKYTIDINYSKIGYLFSAITMVKEKKQAEASEFSKFVIEILEAIQVYKITGEWDFAVIWLCKDPEALDVVISKVVNHPNVDRVQTTFFMRALKRENGVPLDRLLAPSIP